MLRLVTKVVGVFVLRFSRHFTNETGGTALAREVPTTPSIGETTQYFLKFQEGLYYGSTGAILADK
jgi:hypothetical protein